MIELLKDIVKLNKNDYRIITNIENAFRPDPMYVVRVLRYSEEIKETEYAKKYSDKEMSEIIRKVVTNKVTFTD